MIKFSRILSLFPPNPYKIFRLSHGFNLAPRVNILSSRLGAVVSDDFDSDSFFGSVLASFESGRSDVSEGGCSASSGMKVRLCD